MRPHYKPPQLHHPELEAERHATWLELFFDLVFVVAITQLSDKFSDHLTLTGMWQFLALFIPVIWAWGGHTVYATRFDSDDLVHRILTFVIMFAAAIMTVQIPRAFGEGANGFAVGYILARVTLLLLYLRVLFIPTVKHMTWLYLIGFGLGVSCWCISLFVEPPIKFYLWALGIAVDFLTPTLGKKRILSKLPVDTRHIPERFGLFTIIVLGECVAAVVLGLTHSNLHWQAMLASIMSFVLATLIWLQYYSYMQAANYKCSLNSGQSFIFIHFPLVISIVIIGVGVEHMIIAAASSTLLSKELNIIFCSSLILWLISFFLLQCITMRKCNRKLLGRLYALGVIAIAILFIFSTGRPLVKIIGVNIIFSIIIGLNKYFLRPQEVGTC
jgi:low temperature requirement protein LtrA